MNRLKMWALLCCIVVTKSHSMESKLMLDNGEYQVPAIFSTPEIEQAYPAIILLHGTASHKNEVGDLYVRLAQMLLAKNIASIRIDFAGTGDSQVDYSKYTLESAVRDAGVALDYLKKQPQIAQNRIAVLGFSQGGLIAQMLATKESDIAALVTWSSVAGNGKGPFKTVFDDYYLAAKRDGVAELTFEWRTPLKLSLDWFKQVELQASLSDLNEFTKPILAVAGEADRLVNPLSSLKLIQASGSDDAQVVILKGANHIFNVLSPDAKQDETLLKTTVQWLQEKLH
ncbi:alpha/beta hydrolase family protein [Aliiglaciecola lipolytica]|nr:alpha/beta fold hydrolase [Aliiglaciecola lipolytica]